MDRRNFVQSVLLASASPLVNASIASDVKKAVASVLNSLNRGPLAIAMWDFSWLERRWPGAGYENWDVVLDELLCRGYNAVRIDAYPHLIALDPEREWELLPEWNMQAWGAPGRCIIKVQPSLNEFIKKCKARGIEVALSTWFRQDVDDVRLNLTRPEDHIRIRGKTLESIAREGLLDNILYVDFNNEFPVWCKFLPDHYIRNSPGGYKWMKIIEDGLRTKYKDIPFTFSFAHEFINYKTENVSTHDFLELHLWMTLYSEFYSEINYNFERFDPKGFENVQLKAEKLYRSKPLYWQNKLKEGVDLLIDWSKLSGKPLVTTECWGIVDYKDFPMLNWDWVKDLCAIETIQAAASGRWLAIATSNFCGPQFVGMWRDIKWHQRLTTIIKTAQIDPSFEDNRLMKRIFHLH
ncbi:MAG: cellulase [Chitinophagaceae bacterium]|nr:cellulase [Chitinophagaceae bacterium]